MRQNPNQADLSGFEGPVSRLRLLAARTGIGWLGASAVIAVPSTEMWLAMLPLRGTVAPVEVIQEAAVLISCGSTFYFLSVLLGTVLDDQWRIWCTLLSSSGIWWFSAHRRLPDFADIFRGMGDHSPIIAHAMPWNVMLFSTGMSIVLFGAATMIAQRQEY